MRQILLKHEEEGPRQDAELKAEISALKEEILAKDAALVALMQAKDAEIRRLKAEILMKDAALAARVPGVKPFSMPQPSRAPLDESPRRRLPAAVASSAPRPLAAAACAAVAHSTATAAAAACVASVPTIPLPGTSYIKKVPSPLPTPSLVKCFHGF